MATEKRLIYLDEAITRIKDDGILGSGYSDDERMDDVIDILESCHVVDAVEVVHGRWIPSDIDIDEHEECMSDDADFYDWECSACHYQMSYVDPVKRRHLTNYCPNCGAKMDGGSQ